MTYGEAKLWSVIRNKGMKGYRFKRQVPISNYIVDFYCPELMLVIEIDGSSHGDRLEKDKIRQKVLEDLGITVLRFTESDVLKGPDGVFNVISNWVEEKECTGSTNPPPPPPSEGS